jgi:hypothetical protein
VYGRCSAARTRNLTAARSRVGNTRRAFERHELPMFLQSPAAFRITSTSPQCNRGAIPRCLKNELCLGKFQHRNGCASIYRHLRVSMSNRLRVQMPDRTTGATGARAPLLENWHRHSGLAKALGQVNRRGLIPRTNFSDPFMTPSDYDLTFSVPPRLLRMIGAKRNICRGGPSAGSRIRSF